MASSSSSPSDPANYSRSWSYHVFLSFRGEDTRLKFVGHLYEALIGRGIHTYKDDREISYGEFIDTSVTEAIEGSQIAIIVFSENFAESSWCLRELAYIIDCEKRRGLTIVPIFYDVEPTVVRKQKQKYEEVFSQHELKNETDVVASWRKTLRGVSGHSGDEFKSASMDESKFIKKIVKKISKMIRPLTPWKNDKLVGIEDRMHNFISQMQIGSDVVFMIGLWGVGGSGKTTLANSVYNEISWKFDCCCRIENVREKSSKYGLEKLQEQILSSVWKDKKVQIGSVEDGKYMTSEKLRLKKVLILLDDVNEVEQLEALAGSLDWFGKGSRIIITTRDVHLLNVHGVINVHKVSLLNDGEAINLLCKLPGIDKSMGDFEELSQEVVSYASGLPLALTILGSSLVKANIKEQKSILAKMKVIPNDDIQGKLKISYDELKKDVQELFLDIACFLRGEEEARAMEILNACHFEPTAGVKVLKDRALITISNGVIDMHDLVQEMGHHIVKGEGNDGKNPEKQRRVWKEEDVVNICAMDATTNVNMIEAIQFKYIDYTSLPPRGNNPLEHLPPIIANSKNLRWIDWEGDLANPLLTNFPPTTLCCLTLTRSMQDQLWKGYKFLPCLKIMELSDLTNLTRTPDFSGIPNLERFKLYNSPNLEEIDSSFGLLKKLVFVFVVSCPKLKIFPSINRLKNLETLSFYMCKPGLFELPEIQQENMDSVAHPELGNSGETQVQKPGGEDLVDVEECCLEKASSSHNNINRHTRLWVSHSNLTKLDLGWCNLKDEDIGSFDWELPNLLELNLSYNSFSRLDFSLLGLPKLKWLNVRWCQSLVELKDLPSSISVIHADYCKSLKRFGDTSNCKWLWKVSNLRGNKVDPSDGAALLKSMLKGNAIDQDHFISVFLEHQIPVGFEGSFFKGETFMLRSYIKDTFTLPLRDNWDNDFCGLLMRVVSQEETVSMDIKISKHESDKEYDYVFLKDSDEEPEPEYDGRAKYKGRVRKYKGRVRTYVGYVPFSALRQTTSLNSSNNTISFSIHTPCWDSFTAELIPRKNKDDPLQTTKPATNSPQFSDEKDRPSFKIEQDSKSFVNIYWKAFW
ncbi:hypothetical protein LXL04_021771 [Taraxacum kok-saghyz]